MNYIFIPILKYSPLFIRWFLGIYITLFAMCFYVHVNESNIIANKAEALITQITHTKSSLVKVSSVQNMTRKTKPSFLEPYTIISSLLGKREPYKLINKLLGNAIENDKAKLAGIALGQVDLEAADLSNADMYGVYLRKANLAEANLAGANLISAKLSMANLRGATLLNTNLYKADFSNTILNGANLEYSQGITCAQIKSAVINENTRFPSYISLEGSTESIFKCVNSRKGTGMDISRINLANAYLVRADFSKSNLSHANFLNADLSQSNFSSANLSKANLKGANLFRAASITCEQIKSAVIDENTRLPDSISLVGPIKASSKCVNLLKREGLDLNGIILENLYLESANFSKSNLSNANFLNAILSQSNFSSANLSKANLKKANLIRAAFHEANLTGANLTGADLREANLTGANLTGANLTGADLRGALLNLATSITCEQIKSAVIDENTRLPDYISLTGSPGSAYKCENILNKN
jgi:uncharacterized protein YjbI with pentapeptide repeats